MECNSNANDAELFNGELRILVFDSETRFSFSEKKNPNRADTLTMRILSELRL